MIRHIHMPIDEALVRLNLGINLFEDQYTTSEAIDILHEMQDEGKKYIAGCDNTDELGRCKCGENDL